MTKKNTNEAFENLFLKATSYANSGNFKEALKLFEQAYEINPTSYELLWNVGIINEEVGQIDKAIQLYELTLQLNPDAHYLLGNLLLARMRVCNWVDYEMHIDALMCAIQKDKKVCPPFAAAALYDSPKLQLKVASQYGNDLFPEAYFPENVRTQNTKIRVAYFSADFHNHATAFLMMELFELHNREKFELYAFSFGPDKRDESRDRIVQAFDHFYDVSTKSDDEILEKSRNLNIDIAVDLKGYTRDMRMGIFSKRVAPIQINYLGYPGTMGVNYYDYIIADKVLIPEHSRECYSEKIIYLPDTYQANDSKRHSNNIPLKKMDFGFSQNTFIFCCFNSSYKINPYTFDSWVRILKAVPNSVLWLYEDNSRAAENLRSESAKRGVEDRVVFAKQMPLQEHLNRLSIADLVLDTFPYGAHTTASDALLVGVPVVTLRGESFASRVASSLLTALGLEELITQTQFEFEKLAIFLATESLELLRIKEKTKKNRATKKLFSTGDFVANLEVAYSMAIEARKYGMKNDHIYVP